MADFIFRIGEHIITLHDLAEPMNSEFLALHESQFSQGTCNLTRFRHVALDFLTQNDGNFTMHDAFFNNFTAIWRVLLTESRFKHADELMRFALEIAHQWEEKNPGKKIHKGSPFYFCGGASVLEGDLERGFLLMHRAYEEDRRTSGRPDPKTPAWFFITLDDEKQAQLFRPVVQDAAAFLDQEISEYRQSRGRN